MGSINFSTSSLVDSLIDIIGYKSGIVLNSEQLSSLLMDHNPELAKAMRLEEESGVRLHSVEFEELVAYLLYKLGNIDSPEIGLPTGSLYRDNKNDPERFEIYQGVLQEYIEFMGRILQDPTVTDTLIDPRPLMVIVTKKYGRVGLDIVVTLMKNVDRSNHLSPWGRVREVDWKDTVALSELFNSEKLETLHGAFFDQRFIDYLNQNFDDIANINWRKFEGLAGEYFDREGFYVDMGPGRNDDGIDLRIYPKEKRDNIPPLMIVQCKRQKQKIGKALIKSVYADVLHENAESGLIVTSSYFSPGASELRFARAYPVSEADRDTLKEWVKKMKTQRTGIL